MSWTMTYPPAGSFCVCYKKNAKHFKSIYVPHLISYVLCFLWEKYSTMVGGAIASGL